MLSFKFYIKCGKTETSNSLGHCRVFTLKKKIQGTEIVVRVCGNLKIFDHLLPTKSCQ